MAAKNLTTIDVTQIKTSDLYSLIESTIYFAQPVVPADGGKLHEAFSKLENDFQHVGDLTNKPTLLMLKLQVAELDVDRDDCFAEIKQSIVFSLKDNDSVKRGAAKSLLDFLEPYWDINFLAMNEETTKFQEMFNLFNSNDTFKTFASIIGIKNMMAGLETLNNKFEKAYRERNSKSEDDDVPGLEMKNVITNCYEHFCKCVEQAIRDAPNARLQRLFVQMDKLRRICAIQLIVDHFEV